ncbi:hypothetical protein J4218_06180 [Candidatus Pacearchaeota archaeon]|nr:hypothetical protein [Candidatus Pacearchaeota archaeon]
MNPRLDDLLWNIFNGIALDSGTGSFRGPDISRDETIHTRYLTKHHQCSIGDYLELAERQLVSGYMLADSDNVYIVSSNFLRLQKVNPNSALSRLKIIGINLVPFWSETCQNITAALERGKKLYRFNQRSVFLLNNQADPEVYDCSELLSLGERCKKLGASEVVFTFEKAAKRLELNEETGAKQ